jgi:hypothetical protein
MEARQPDPKNRLPGAHPMNEFSKTRLAGSLILITVGLGLLPLAGAYTDFLGMMLYIPGIQIGLGRNEGRANVLLGIIIGPLMGLHIHEAVAVIAITVGCGLSLTPHGIGIGRALISVSDSISKLFKTRSTPSRPFHAMDFLRISLALLGFCALSYAGGYFSQPLAREIRHPLFVASLCILNIFGVCRFWKRANQNAQATAPASIP